MSSKQQRFANIITQRRVFNYGNEANVFSPYHSFFSAASSGGLPVSDNQLVLNNDTSKLLFYSDQNTGFDTQYTWSCLFNDNGSYAFLPETRTTGIITDATNNNFLSPDAKKSSLNITINGQSNYDGHVYYLASRNPLKISPCGRLYAEYQGIFETTVTTANVTTFYIGYKNGVDFVREEQPSWNIDTFGKGSKNPSGLSLDFTKIKSVVFSSYDKVIGDLLVGFLMENTIYWAHRISVNNGNDKIPFANLNLPIIDTFVLNTSQPRGTRRIGIANNDLGVFFESDIDTTNEPSTGIIQAAMSCSAYEIGAPEKQSRLPFTGGLDASFVTVTNPDTPLFSIKAADLFGIDNDPNNTVFGFDKVKLSAAGANLNYGCNIKLVYNGTLANDTFAGSPNSQSALKVDTTADSISGGIELYSDYIYANQRKIITPLDLYDDFVNVFSRTNITYSTGAGTASLAKDGILTVVASPMTGTPTLNVSANMNGFEIG